MAKNLYLAIGLPGSGKSTYIKEHFSDSFIISRDDIRFEMMGESSKYFEKEKEVFNEFVYRIQTALDKDSKNVIADATHINQKSRNKLLNKLKLKGVKIHILFINTPVEKCLERNHARDESERLPDKVITDFYQRLELPSHSEKYKYISIIEVKNS